MSSQSLKKLKKEMRITALDPGNNTESWGAKSSSIQRTGRKCHEVCRSIYYKEVPIESKKLSGTMIVTYSPKYKAYQAKD